MGRSSMTSLKIVTFLALCLCFLGSLMNSVRGKASATHFLIETKDKDEANDYIGSINQFPGSHIKHISGVDKNNIHKIYKGIEGNDDHDINILKDGHFNYGDHRPYDYIRIMNKIDVDNNYDTPFWK